MNIVSRIKGNFNLTPALRLLIWYFLGSSFVTIYRYLPSSPIFIFFVAVLLGLIYVSYERHHWFEIFFLIFAIINTIITTWQPTNHYANFLNYPNENKEIEIRFNKNFYAKDSLFATYSTSVEVTTINNKKCSGKSLFINTKQFISTNYYQGTIIKGRGSFYLLNKANNYEQSLIYQGYTHKVILSEINEIKQQVPNWLSKIQHKVIKRVTRELDDNNKGLIIAMYLGFKNALSYQDKQTYQNSGIMHIFAVSGLHIGIIFTILSLLAKLCFISIRWRCLIIPLLLLFYVILIGSSASAVRAWLMLSIWQFSQLFWRPTFSLNTLSLTALLIILFDPLAYLQGGFQYSFLIVSLLILANGYLQAFFNCLEEKRIWGLNNPSIFHKIFINLIRFSLIMFMAWLASIPLNLYFNYRFIPASFLINLILGFIIWLTLFFALLKTFLPALFILPLNFLLSLADNISQEVAPLSIIWGEISDLAFFTYYFLLILALWLPIRWPFRLSLLLIPITLILYPRLSYQSQLYCFIAAGELTPQITYLTNKRQVITINAPSYLSQKATKKYLQRHGFSSSSQLLLPHQIAQYNRGLIYTELPQKIISTPLKRQTTNLYQFYKKNPDWQKRWFNSSTQGITWQSNSKKATITMQRYKQKLVIDYQMNNQHSTLITYSLWENHQLLKQYNFCHFSQLNDKNYIIKLPADFLVLF